MSEDLARRVEALAAPCRETDAEIWRATATLPSGYRWQVVNGAWCQIGLGGVSDLEVCEARYTASLDAAIALVPVGCRRIEFGSYGDGGAWAYVHTPADIVGEATGPTEAAALTAAALRARATGAA